jgi:hypothetical protein
MLERFAVSGAWLQDTIQRFFKLLNIRLCQTIQVALQSLVFGALFGAWNVFFWAVRAVRFVEATSMFQRVEVRTASYCTS